MRRERERERRRKEERERERIRILRRESRDGDDGNEESELRPRDVLMTVSGRISTHAGIMP